MAPLKKVKKMKKKKKLKSKQKPTSASQSEKSTPAPDSKSIDSDWWDTFRQRNSTSVQKISEDEEVVFKHFLRVSRKTFDYICSLVSKDLVSRPPSGLINIEGRLLSVEKQVAIALRRLASGESQVSVGWMFGVGQSTVSQVTWRFIESMEERGKHHLKWPDTIRMDEIKDTFERRYGLPSCCGAIDATHIIMTLPAVETSDDWRDQESNYSMFLQGIVDYEMRFLDIVTGWPGGMSISRLLKCSGFFKLCESGERLNGCVKLSGAADIRDYIVGNTAYPLLPWLITSYEDNNLPAYAESFNEKHTAARLLAEKALSQLKGSWRILHKVIWRPDKHKLPSIILVSCLLHNIIIDCGDKLHSDVPLPNHHDAGYKEQKCPQVDPNGHTMRENLSEYLHSCEQAPN